MHNAASVDVKVPTASVETLTTETDPATHTKLYRQLSARPPSQPARPRKRQPRVTSTHTHTHTDAHTHTHTLGFRVRLC